MNKRIIISVSNDLTTDQRVMKVATSLSRNGYDVLLIGRQFKNSMPLTTDIAHKRFKLWFNRGILFYAALNVRLFLFLLFAKADIYYSNDTDTLPACFLAVKLRKKRLVFDAHELFPEVPELQNRPFTKKCWVLIENLFFPHLETAFTVCHSIADYYRQKYHIDMEVIRNTPYMQSVNQNINQKKITIPGKKIILYQGAINTGRGLEWVIDAMPFINDAVLYIIGDGDLFQILKQKVSDMKLESKVIFHGKVPGEELQQYTSSGDIGLCLLEKKGLSYYYSLPNRVFAYLHAHVPILASPFPEIARIVDTYHTGVLTDEYEPRKLANTISEMLKNPFDTNHFNEIKEKFCWETEEKTLLKHLQS